MTIYGYTRVSTDEQGDGTSLDTQRTMITGVAMSNALPTDITFIAEAGVSGGSAFFNRPAVSPINWQPGDVIICSALDRFSRDARDCLNAIHKLKELGVSLFLNGHGDVTDDANLTGRLMLEVMAAFAGHERRIIKDRCAKGRRAKRQAGGHIGGSAPYGFRIEGTGKDAQLQPLEWQEDAYRDMRSMHARGLSLRAIAKRLSDEYDDVSHMSVSRALNAEQERQESLH